VSQPEVTDPERQRGFALLIVLWTLVLISFLVAHLTAAGRTEMRIAGNLAGNAAAQAAADGAVYQAIFNLSDPRPDRRWALDGAVHELSIAQSRIALRLENEAARINPSLASPALVEALLRIVGADPERSAALAAAIAEWVGQPTKSRQRTALANFTVAGLDYRPPRSPLEGIEELARVRGMTPNLLAALRPHLTLFGPAEPDPAAADPEVAAALAIAGQLAADAGATPSGSSGLLTVRIVVTAQGPGNALATRIAVARVGPRQPNGYSLLAWDSDEE